MNVCVFSSSSNLIPEKYIDLAIQFGEMLAKEDHTLVYGGGKVGLMGRMGDAVLKNGGKKIGVIPKRLRTVEVAADDDTEQFVTENMHQRKEKLVSISDSFVAFPGGFGTLDELLEVITLKQLGYHDKPVLILNYDGFFDGLIQQFDQIYKEHFAKQNAPYFQVVSGLETLMNKLNEI